jgi:transposase
MMKQKPSAPRQDSGAKLPAIQPNVAGIDIGSREMYVCGPAQKDGHREVRAFTTTTGQIHACADWLKQQQVQSVALESTGVYWIPVLEILESRGLETLLVDTRPLSRVPGRKTDVEDCQWIQTLHSHGLLQSSYRPSEEISQLRTIVRQKAVLVREQADWVRRMHKCLDQMNVRLHHAVSDTQGVTGMAILRSIVDGERDPVKLAKLRDPGCRHSEEEIAEFLTGHWRSDHLFNLKQNLLLYDSIAERISAHEQEIQQRMEGLVPQERKDVQAPALSNRGKRKNMRRRGQEGKRQTLYRMLGVDLTTIDGIGVETAEVIISEYGINLSKFPTEREFVSHLQLAPHRPVSGGKVLKKRRHSQKGTRTAEALRNAATTLRKSSSALGAYYRRIARRKDSSIAVFATARKLATYVYRMLRWGQTYVDIGQEAYEQRYQAVRLRTIKTTVAQLGYQLVKVEPASAPVKADPTSA